MTDLSGFQPNVEAIAGYEPDLVIAAYDPGGLVDGLEKVGIPVLLQDAAKDLDAAFAQIETLGAATGHVEEAQAVADDMKSRDRRAGRLGARHGERRDRLPRARAGLLLGHLGHVHRLDLRAARPREHRRRGEEGRHRLPAAVGRVHRQGRPGPDRPRGHEVLRPDGGTRRQAAGLEGRLGRDRRRRRRGERRHHLALGAADGRLRRARRRGARGGGGRLVLRTGGVRARLPARRRSPPCPESRSAGRSAPASSSSCRPCSGSRSGRSASAPGASSTRC